MTITVSRPSRIEVSPLRLSPLGIHTLFFPDGRGIWANRTGRGGYVAGGSAQKFGGGPGGMGALYTGAANESAHTGFGNQTTPALAAETTLFGVLSLSSIGSAQDIFAIGSTDSRLEYRMRIDSTNGLSISYINSGYAVDANDTVQMGAAPTINSVIAFVARFQSTALGGDRLFVTSDGKVAGAPTSNNWGGGAGIWDIGSAGSNSFNGSIYLLGAASGLWQRDEIGAFFADPYHFLRASSRYSRDLAPQASSAAIDLNFATMASNDALDAGITLERGSDGTRINASGLYETETGANPRFMFDPVSLAPRGLLIERESTNYALNSIDISNASWVKSGLTVTANDGTAPDGTNNGDLLDKTASGDAYVYASFTTANNEDWTLSAVVKPGTQTQCRLWAQFFGGTGGLFGATFNLVGPGEITAAGASGGSVSIKYARIERAPSGYYRVIVSGKNDATGNTVGILVMRPGAADGDTGTMWMWHGQAEKLARHTSPIISGGTAATRSAERCRYLGGLTLPCWMLTEWETTAPSLGLRYIAIANDGDLSDFIAAAQSLDTPSLDTLATHSYSASVDQGVIIGGTWDPYGREIHRLGVKVKDNDYVVLGNRGLRDVDTNISRPLTLNEIWIGARWDTTTGHNDDVIRRVRTLADTLGEPEILSIVRPEHKPLALMGVG